MKKFNLILIFILSLMSKIFAANQPNNNIIQGKYLHSSGQYECRKVDSNYRTEIDGYDLKKRIVFCKVYPNSTQINSDKALAGDAGIRVMSESYEEWLKNNDTYKKLINLHPASQAIKYGSDFLGGYDVADIEQKDGFKLSDYIVGLAVLKGFDVDKAAGMRETINEVGGLFSSFKESSSEKTTNVAKTLNQANINYFKNLYYSMNSVYIHLQNLLFICWRFFSCHTRRTKNPKIP